MARAKVAKTPGIRSIKKSWISGLLEFICCNINLELTLGQTEESVCPFVMGNCYVLQTKVRLCVTRLGRNALGAS